jgi:hypothetical protein
MNVDKVGQKAVSQRARSTIINHHISADDNKTARSAAITRLALVVQQMSSNPPRLVLLAITGFTNGVRGGATNRLYKYYNTSSALYCSTESGCRSQEIWRLLYLIFCQGRASLLPPFPTKRY